MRIPKRIKAYFLQGAASGSLGSLETSWDVRKTLKKVRNYKFKKGDFQYVIISTSLLFCFCIISEPILVFRLAIALALGLAIAIPITSQFFFPFLPIATWLVLFYANSFIPVGWRPAIYVRVLPALETIMYGGNLSNVLSSSTNAALDLLAWVPYGLIHFSAPFIVSAIIFLFAPPTSLPVFSFAFGWMNFIGVLIQILFPTAPPWYQNIHGLDPANYSMPGSPGGLARIDKLLGLNMYTGTFSASPLVFGAFPSLHSGCATMEVLFLCHVFPRYSVFFFGYMFWIWWSTMYLTHHYFIDLIGGSILSYTVFYAVKRSCLPRLQPGKVTRWAYEYVELGEPQARKLRKSIDDEYIELPFYTQDTESKEDAASVATLTANSAVKGNVGSAASPISDLNSLPLSVNTDINPYNIDKASVSTNSPASHQKSSSYYLYDDLLTDQATPIYRSSTTSPVELKAN